VGGIRARPDGVTLQKGKAGQGKKLATALGPVNANGFIVAGGHFSARRGRMSVV